MSSLQMYPLFKWHTHQTVRKLVDCTNSKSDGWISDSYLTKYEIHKHLLTNHYLICIFSSSFLSSLWDHDALGGPIYNLRRQARSKGVSACGSHHAVGQNVVAKVTSAAAIAEEAKDSEEELFVQFGLKQTYLAPASSNRRKLISSATQYFLCTYVAHTQYSEAFSTGAKNIHQ